MAHGLTLRQELVYGAFSWSLLVAGLVAALIGMLLDRFGGQWIMATGSALCGAGLIWLSQAAGVVPFTPRGRYWAWRCR